jgi:hypothetical protein
MRRMEKKVYRYLKIPNPQYDNTGTYHEYFQEAIESWDADHDPHGNHEVRIVRQINHIVSGPKAGHSHYNEVWDGLYGGEFWQVAIIGNGCDSLHPHGFQLERSTKRKFESGLRRAQTFLIKAIAP